MPNRTQKKPVTSGANRAGRVARLRQHIADLIFPEGVERRNLLEREANMDPLTGLGNRRAFELARPAAELDQELGFAFFDLNNFGLVNKTAGHAAGDKILQNFSEVFKVVARLYNARAFRSGGDEFVVICNERFAADLRDSIENKIGELEFDNFTVSISGETGATAAEADSTLQRRKLARKQQQSQVVQVSGRSGRASVPAF